MAASTRARRRQRNPLKSRRNRRPNRLLPVIELWGAGPPVTTAPPRRLRLGMVGGGQGAFIGEAHRIAARLDDRYELVAGALSRDPQRAIASGHDLRLDPRRCYADMR